MSSEEQEDSTQNETEKEPKQLRSSFAFVHDDEDIDLNDDEGQVFDVAVNEAEQEVEEIPINNQEETEQPTPDPERTDIAIREEEEAPEQELAAPTQEPKIGETTQQEEGPLAYPTLEDTGSVNNSEVNQAEPVNDVKETNPVESKKSEPKQEVPKAHPAPAPKKIEPLEMEEEEESEISFIVKTPAGKKFNLKLDPETSIDEVKETLAKMENQDLEAKEIKLILKGKPLNNGAKTIKQVGIMKDMKVYMIKQLYGASGAKNQVGPSIQRSTEAQRGFITITIPEGARPGNRLIIHPPGRQRMVVYVPRGMGPGDALRVQLPNSQGGQQTGNNQRTNRPNNTGVDPTQALQNANINYNTVLKAVCPQDARPGQEVRINVPNVGVLKVSIPASARPGQPFYFRVPPL